LPNWTIQLPTEQMQGFAAMMWETNLFLPVSELVALAGVIAAFLAVLHGWKAVLFVWDTIVGIIP